MSSHHGSFNTVSYEKLNLISAILYRCYALFSGLMVDQGGTYEQSFMIAG